MGSGQWVARVSHSCTSLITLTPAPSLCSDWRHRELVFGDIVDTFEVSSIALPHNQIPLFVPLRLSKGVGLEPKMASVSPLREKHGFVQVGRASGAHLSTMSPNRCPPCPQSVHSRAMAYCFFEGVKKRGAHGGAPLQNHLACRGRPPCLPCQTEAHLTHKYEKLSCSKHWERGKGG